MQRPPRLARIGSAAKSIAPCRMQLYKIRLKICTVGCDVLQGVAPEAQAIRSTPRHSATAAPQNQANCNAKKFAWWAAMRYAVAALKVPAQPFAPRLQLRFRSRRKINCSLQNALAAKAAWWAAMCYAGLTLKVLTFPFF